MHDNTATGVVATGRFRENMKVSASTIDYLWHTPILKAPTSIMVPFAIPFMPFPHYLGLVVLICVGLAELRVGLPRSVESFVTVIPFLRQSQQPDHSRHVAPKPAGDGVRVRIGVRV